VADETDRLVLVGFFASEWCKACQAAVPWFHRMAAAFPQIKFVHVPVTAANVNLHQGLGVERLPSGHLYHPTLGLMEDNVRLTKAYTAGAQSQVSQLLQWYLQGSCELMGVGDVRDPMEVKPKSTPAEPRPMAVTTKTLTS
jgi:thiol-disulfide isomerase/thioredoxin